MSNSTTTTAGIGWANGGSETAWEVAIQAQGTGTPGGAGTATAVNPYNATGLTAQTDYEVYVRSDCGAINGQSTWTGPYTFCTTIAPLNCTQGGAGILLTQSFDNNSGQNATLPAGWTRAATYTGNRRWLLEDFQPTSGVNSGPSGGATATPGYCYFESSTNGANNTDTLISPPIDLTGASGAARVKFFRHMFVNTAVANNLKGEFYNAKLITSRKNKKDGKDEYYVIKEDIQDVLKAGNNIVFLETQNEGFVSNVSSILASLIQEENEEEKLEAIDIVLTTTKMNSAFEGDEVDNTHLSNLQFSFASSSKSYGENNAFVKRYEKLYNSTPNGAAIRGFDLTMDVVLRVVTSEDLYMSVTNAPLTEYVENKFAYKRKSFGGYYNDTVYLVKYQDLTIVEIKQ